MVRIRLLNGEKLSASICLQFELIFFFVYIICLCVKLVLCMTVFLSISTKYLFCQSVLHKNNFDDTDKTKRIKTKDKLNKMIPERYSYVTKY